MVIPDRFLGAIGGDVGSCVLIVGAGLSKDGVRKRGAGIPDWDQLMQLMLAHLEKTGRRDKAELEQIRVMLSEEPPRYLDVADNFRNAHADDQDGYEIFLRRHLMPDDLIESALHKTILSIGFCGIVSYNFDLVFERQSDKLAPIVYPELMDQIGHLQRRGFFAKIHGCISRPARQLVLTGAGYDEINHHPNYSRLIQTVLFAHKVLCVGFSLRDPAFQSIIADLKDRWGEVLPPLFALMRNPGDAERAAWLKKGIDILPYDRHDEITGFFTDLATLSAPRDRRARSGVAARAKKRTKRGPSEFGGRLERVGAASSDIVSILEEWEDEQNIEEMDGVLSRHLDKLRAIPDKEALLFQLAALCKQNQAPHLCRQLIALDSPRCNELAAKIIEVAAESDNLRILTPHRLHVPLHRWLMMQEEWKFASGFHGKAAKHILTWLLDEAWGAQGIDLWTTFLAILTRMKSSFSRHGLDDLYTVAAHIPGAASEIEKVINSKDFIREDDKERRWYKSWDQQIVEAIRFEKFRNLFAGSDRPPAEMLAEAFALEAALPERVYRPYTEIVIARLLDAFVHRTHLTLHSSSDSYNPARANEILEAFAGLRIPKQQLSVLWAVSHWPERMRGLMSLGEDSASLRNRLFVPLWWRYSSETRIEYLRGHRRGLAAHPERTGQELLLEDVMGLHYDLDQDFRQTFNLSLDRYQDPARPGHYEPRPLQELWSEQELKYQLVDECPPELVRRIAVQRVDWENSQSAAVRWAEANERATQIFPESQSLRRYASAERADYVIDNLLGAYFPTHRRIALYTKMIQYAADDLGVDADALMTVVYAHETVHAFSHLGRDLNGRMWNGFALPRADLPDSRPSKPHEAIAQFYTFKLLEHVNDKQLMDVFLTLERSCDPIYRAWRQTEHFSLEAMRQVLIRYRNGDSEWPPDL
jgi:hypothetical protein